MKDYVEYEYRMREAGGGAAGWEPEVVARFVKIVTVCPPAPPEETNVVYIFLRPRGHRDERLPFPIPSPDDRYAVRLEDIYRVDPEIAETIDRRYTPRPGTWIVAVPPPEEEVDDPRVADYLGCNYCFPPSYLQLHASKRRIERFLAAIDRCPSVGRGESAILAIALWKHGERKPEIHCLPLADVAAVDPELVREIAPHYVHHPPPNEDAS